MSISPDERYLTVKELSEKIKFSQQSIYNMIHKGVFVKGRDYIKPRPKRFSSSGRLYSPGWNRRGAVNRAQNQRLNKP